VVPATSINARLPFQQLSLQFGLRYCGMMIVMFVMLLVNTAGQQQAWRHQRSGRVHG
jgi:hypothetical protein